MQMGADLRGCVHVRKKCLLSKYHGKHNPVFIMCNLWNMWNLRNVVCVNALV